jgi:phosphopantothenoylcysteine decarboxylase/phosphopantothenate--cysteine ligase
MTHPHSTKILITSGATQEPLDGVRYLCNHSSGKLGSMIALAAVTQGYEVTLLYGNHSVLPTCHPRLHTTPYSSTRDLKAKLDENWPSHSILIMAAAVSDYTPSGGQTKGKISRKSNLTLELTPTEDLVAAVANSSRADQRIIAFALEESTLLELSAKAKLNRKKVDAIVANPLETMNSSTIKATVFLKDGSSMTPESQCSKPEFAHWLIENLQEIVRTTSSTP